MVWSDKIDEFSIQMDEKLIVSIDLESREFNGRWYTDVKAWKVSRDGASSNTPDNSFNSDPPMDDALDDVIPF